MLIPAPSGLLYVVTLLYIGAHALIISALSGLGPISRTEWGQRYLLSAYPLLVVLALITIERTRSSVVGSRSSFVLRPSSFVRPAFAALVAVGLIFTARGYAVLYDERTQVHEWLALARTLPEREPLVTNDWWLPLNLAADFYTRPIMLAEDDDHLTRWATQMRDHGVTRFGLMTARPDVFTGTWRSALPNLQTIGQPVEVRGIWLQQYTFDAPADAIVLRPSSFVLRQ